MKKVFDLRKMIKYFDENNPMLLVLFAKELDMTGHSRLMDFQGLTDPEVGKIVGGGYGKRKDDDSMDFAFVDESDFVPMTVRETQEYIAEVMFNSMFNILSGKLSPEQTKGFS